MKTKIPILVLVFCLSLLSTFSNAQGVWEVQNPLPTAEALIDVYSLNSSTAWAVGSAGCILKTVDGGNTWTNLNSGTSEDLNSVRFYDVNTGWVVGTNGTILKTSNGGNTWSQQTSNTTMSLVTVQLFDNNILWVLGSDWQTNTSICLKTINGGITWTIQSSFNIELKDMFFINSSTGWTCGKNGSIYKTINGGSSWTSQSSGSTRWLNSVYFVNSSVGWAVGDDGITKTLDGGTSWNLQLNAFGNTTAFDCYFVNENVGYVIGYDYHIPGQVYQVLETVNGGASWIVLKSDPLGGYKAINFSNSTSGLIVGRGIYKTTNGGSTWLFKTTGVGITLRKIHFVDENNGCTVGQFGTILKTYNGGSNWIAQTSGTNNDLNDVFFTDSNNGWAVGSGGIILNTTNGGSTWSIQTSGTLDPLYSVWFISTTVGWAVGGHYSSNGAVILKTYNGGATWTPQPIANPNVLALKYVRFFDGSNGLAVSTGSTAYILKTINGGLTWAIQTINYPGLDDVFFINANTGWANSSPNTLKKTTDGGSTWTTQLSNYPKQFYCLFFYDINNGWVALDRAILKTTNGGSTWLSEIYRTSNGAISLYFVEPKVGWAAGAQGAIMHYTDYSPATQASNVTITGTTYQNLNVSWTRGNGNQSALFAKQTNTGTCTPDVNVTYLPNPTFGLGDQIGSTGWYCVYNGAGTLASVSGLQANTAYRFQVCEYNFSPDFTHYNTTTATNNPVTATTAIAPPQITVNPSDKTLCEPLNTTFSVTASGSGLSYQWQVDAGSGFVNITNGGVYSGCSTSNLALTGIPAGLNGYKYHCVVTNTSGSATSSGALLTVNPLPITPADISGTQVVCLNSSYPYTVPPVQYATSYAWTYPAGFSGTSTTNNINLTTSSGAVPGNITVKGLNGCGSGPVKSFPVSVRNLPANASQITGLNSVCTGSINIGYNTAAISDADYYVWSLPLGASGTSATNSIMISYGPNPVSDQIIVKGHNICGDGVQSVLPVSINTVPEAIGTISGSSNLCKNQKDVLFSINAIPNATSYVWTLPQGIAGSNSTNSVSLDIGPEAYSGDVKVSGVNSCGTGAEIVFPVIVNAAPDPSGTITGPAKVCRGETNVQYSVPKSDKATSYIWSLPDGTSETTIANKIALNFDNNTQSGNLTVSPTNSCGSGDSKSLFIVVSVPSKPEITSDNYQAESCLGETPLKLSVKEALPGYNYLWYKNGVSISSDASSWLEGYLSSGNYTVEADLDGCTTQSEIFKVHFSDAPDKPTIFSKGPTVWYLACSNENAPHYKWYYNGNIISGADQKIYVAGQNLGKYYVLVGNTTGCFTASDEITIPSVITGLEDIDLIAGLKIYPNPTSGKLTVEMNNNIFGDLKISILNQSGKVMSTTKIKKTTEELLDQIDLSALSKGIYYIQFMINGFNSSQKIIIE